MSGKRIFQAASPALILLFTVAMVAVAQEQPRPEIRPLSHVDVPQFTERSLANGVRVILIEHHEIPVVSLRLVVLCGSGADPEGKEGLASLTAAMLREGTAKHSSQEISERIDFIGGNLGAEAGKDSTLVSCNVLSGDLVTGMELLAEVSMRPQFSDEELGRHKQQLLSALQVNLQDAGTVAQNLMNRAIFGDLPYGHEPIGSMGSVSKLKSGDLKAFHAKHYQPQLATLIIAGDVEPEEAFALASKQFSGWKKGEAEIRGIPPAPRVSGLVIATADIPQGNQSQIRFGNVGINAVSSDYYPLMVMNTILGGTPSSRLFKSLRREKGLTYSAASVLSALRSSGPLFCATFSRNEKVSESIRTIFTEIRKLQQEPVGEEELRQAKAALLGMFARQIETPGGVAGSLAKQISSGLEPSALARYGEKINAVTAEEVLRVAQQFLDTENGVLVVVGKHDDILEQLKSFGKVTLYSRDGKPIIQPD